MTGWNEILAAARRERTAFDQACAAPRAAQALLLRQTLAANADTAFGRTHGFSGIRSVEDFRACVPVRTYEELHPWFARIAQGEAGVLTRAPAIAFEETGGSTAGAKLIPYTAASLAGFRAAVLPWLAALAARRPAAFAGRAYVAISPVARAPRTVAGIPVGLAGEGAYLGADLVSAFIKTLAVPPSLAALADVQQWRLATLAHLLAARDLTFISIWSPTLLIGLLEAIPTFAEPLIKSIREGTRALPGDAVRAREVEAALLCDPVDTVRLWPRLDTVSAWADDASRLYAQRLAAMLPHARLQPKGLLATECAVTTPYAAAWPVPALNSAFLEFIDEGGAPRLVDELEPDATYGVVITHAGGFYRYDLGDRLRCRGRAGGLPLLEFVGRARVSDLAGEKLSESFISEALSALQSAACLAPRTAAKPFYELLADADTAVRPDLAALVDRRLCANPQYAYARRIGQLGPVTLRRVEDLLDRYMRAELARGRRLADIKPPVLIHDVGTYAALTKPVDSASSNFRLSFSAA